MSCHPERERGTWAGGGRHDRPTRPARSLATLGMTGVLLLLLGAPAAFARVLSYAPYSESMAARGYHSRTSRHFVVVEGEPPSLYNTSYTHARVVLYDSAGIDEPRVIYPKDGTASIELAALYQESSGSPPVVLVVDRADVFTSASISADGGTTWRQIAGLPAGLRLEDRPDFGGPFTRGLAPRVQIGTADHPFIVWFYQRVIAIRPDGAFRQIGAGRLIGRNREGTRFLVSNDSAFDPGPVSIADLDGRSTPVTDRAEAEYGWITGDGSVYLLSPTAFRPEVELTLHRKGRKPLELEGTSLFAIPTHDFEGAWIVKREPLLRTTLLRHTERRGLERMWSDSAAPDIEALYAGASGQTLLIQQRRPRFSSFRSAALALWRVGQPAPVEYDDLYARFGPVPRFVHLDVDALAAGEPFVFDTAFTGLWNVPFGISPPPPIAGGADVVQEWGIVRASLVQRLVLPAVSRGTGAFGSEWRSDVAIYNPLAARQDVTLRFGSQAKTLTLEPREIRVIEDILATLFSLERGAGPLHIAPQKAVTATSRTYTRSGEGFSMDAIDAVNAATARYPYEFAAAFPAPDFRTNLLLHDVSGRGSEVTLQGFRNVSVGANETAQFGGIDAWLGPGGGLSVAVQRGGVLSTVTAIDNRTNDATYFPPDVVMSEHFERILPVIAHVDYPDGSKLRSDLYAFNPSPLPNAYTLHYRTPEWPVGRGFALGPYEMKVVRDPLATLMGAEGTRPVVVSAGREARVGQLPGVRIVSRLYRIDPDGGTRGMIVPPLNSFQYVSAGERLEIIGQTGPALRMGLGLTHANYQPVRVRVHVFDERGAKIAESEVEVAREATLLIDDVAPSHRGAAARVVVEALTGWIGAFGMLTDTASKDMFYLAASRGGSLD
jgi:hypothetical protein